MGDLVKATLFTLITLFSTYFTYQGAIIANNINIVDKENIIIKEKKEEQEIMTITIPKLNIKNKIYNVRSDQNVIDKNVILMEGSSMPDKENGVILIGAHSGTGKYAYFKNLNMLEINDNVELRYNNRNYVYKVVYKYLDKKDGSISFNNQSIGKKLLLYTCNPNDKNNFLVVICESK